MEEINTVLTKALPEDLDEINALCREVALKTPSSQWDEHYPSRELLQRDIASGSLYKVLHQEKIISIMQIRPWADFAGDEDESNVWDSKAKNPCGLGRFCVSPELQGHGLGRRIMTASLEKARELGYDSAMFHAIEGNDVANHLYESMGFIRLGELQEFGMDFICYEMKLS